MLSKTILFPTERETLKLLADGKKYSEIRALLRLNPSTLHTRLYHIRKKTGIKDTRDKDECRKVFKAIIHSTQKPVSAPTRTQLEIMALIAAAHDYAYIASNLEIKISTLQNQLSQGLKRARITNNAQRKGAIRLYLASRDPIF